MFSGCVTKVTRMQCINIFFTLRYFQVSSFRNLSPFSQHGVLLHGQGQILLSPVTAARFTAGDSLEGRRWVGFRLCAAKTSHVYSLRKTDLQTVTNGRTKRLPPAPPASPSTVFTKPPAHSLHGFLFPTLKLPPVVFKLTTLLQISPGQPLMDHL